MKLGRELHGRPADLNMRKNHKTHLERSPVHMWRAFGSPAWNFSQALGKWTKYSPPGVSPVGLYNQNCSEYH